MEVPPNEGSELPASVGTIHQEQENVLPVLDTINDGAMEQKQEIIEEEVRGALEAIASTGKFWHDWEKLKSMLSFQLKQVLSEYPEAKASGEQQSTLGETFLELVKRLDGALLTFVEGPPFTLQRICEILLDARNIYPNLSKLALALEKNLLVTSTLAVCSDMRLLSSDPKPNESEEPEKAVEEQKLSNAVENGIEPIAGDRDEVMVEVEEADMNDDMTMDMETFEEIVGSSETNNAANSNS